MPPNNFVSIWGNEKTMNMNNLVLTNIQSSPYFKVQLYEIKTYHGVLDEMYYRVSHLEPWERGSRRTAGQTGMCGGTLHGSVRGVGAGGIVSSAFCLLYKLLTLKLTRKQIIGLMNHSDSPYIRGLGFMYIRFTQAPQDLWSWYEDYLDDEEEIDVKAGGGCVMTIGEMLRQWLTKLEWFATLFPRIPVPIQKDIELKLKAHDRENFNANQANQAAASNQTQRNNDVGDVSFGEAERYSRRSPSPRRHTSPRRRPSPPRRQRQDSDDFSRVLSREQDRQRRSGSHDSHSRSHDSHSRSHDSRKHKHEHKRKHRSRSKEHSREQKHKRKHRSRSKEHSREHQHRRSRSGSRDRRKH